MQLTQNQIDSFDRLGYLLFRSPSTPAEKGRARSMILFHSGLVHASGSTSSPWHQRTGCCILCAVSNHIRRFKTPSQSRLRRILAYPEFAGRLSAQGL
jgi:hypothetical protein